MRVEYHPAVQDPCPSVSTRGYGRGRSLLEVGPGFIPN